MRSRVRARFLFIAMLLILPAGCSPSDTAADAERIPVTVSVVPHVWLVERIGDDAVNVVALVQPGESPATYQPVDAQVSRVMRSEVYFRTGVPFENAPWFDGIRKAGVRIVDLRTGIELREIEDHVHADVAHEHADDDHDHGHDEEHDSAADPASAHGKDPHIWLAPSALIIQARTIERTLSELAPARADRFRSNLTRLEAELDRLDTEIRETLAPVRGRAFLVFHPAWGYFADAYGLEQRAIEIEGKEPSDRELTEIQRTARERGIRAVFVQPQITGRGAEAVARSIGARLVTLDPLAPDVASNLRRVAAELAAASADAE